VGALGFHGDTLDTGMSPDRPGAGYLSQDTD
jgi:hypothetical protein